MASGHDDHDPGAFANLKALENPDLFRELLGSLDLPQPITVPSHTPIMRAVEIMNRHGIGCVLIMDEGSLNGIFTERDVLRRVALLELDLATTPISKVMTHRPECLTSEHQFVHALNAMLEGGFRHVPIMRNGVPVAVFGMRDCVRYVVDLFPDSVFELL